jgi:hypothetical protein
VIINNNLTPLNIINRIDSLSGYYDYQFIQSSFGLNYKLNANKYSVAIGARVIKSELVTRNKNTGDLLIVPIARFQYKFSVTQKFDINYLGTPIQPAYNQIQPIPDYTNPTNPIIGNPNLKPGFLHSINAAYENYIVNSKFNIAANLKANFINNQVVNNTILLYQQTLGNFLNYTYYSNLNGNYNLSGTYNISKQTNNRRYIFELNGIVQVGHSTAINNNFENINSTWRFNERLGPKFEPTENVEVNPFFSYDVFRSSNTLPNANNSNVQAFSLNLKGRLFLRTYRINYDISKNFVSGINSNITKNPLIVNFTIEKQFFKRKNGTVQLQVFDLLHQNNFVNRVITPNSITDTRTSALSRYFMLSFVLNLQKWAGSPKSKDGKPLLRKNDGSFISN